MSLEFFINRSNYYKAKCERLMKERDEMQQYIDRYGLTLSKAVMLCFTLDYFDKGYYYYAIFQTFECNEGKT